MEKLNFSQWWGWGREIIIKNVKKSWTRGIRKGNGPQIPTGVEHFIL